MPLALAGLSEVLDVRSPALGYDRKQPMKPIRTILVPVDFSENSRKALEYAADLASRYGATLDVLHVWSVVTFLPTDTPLNAGPQAELVRLVQTNAEAELEKFLAEARQQGVSVTHARAELGVPAQAILDAAKQGGYDLIVMGTRGRGRFAQVLLGSVAERVVRHAHCPVLTVHEQD